MPRKPPTSDPMLWNVDDEVALIADLAKKDFWLFFTTVFGAQQNPKGQKWIDEEVHYPIAQWFQKHVDEWFQIRQNGVVARKHLAVLIQRGVGKTTLITQAGQLWLHLRDPEMSSYTGSEKLELAARMLSSMKAVLDGSDPYSMFTRLYGNWASGARQWTGREVSHSARKNTARKDPSLGIFGVETSIVGAHPDAIFFDDPISYERLESDVNWFSAVNSQVTSLIPVVQADGLICWVGTRYGASDHFGKFLNEEGVASMEGMDTDSFAVDPDGKWHLYFMAGKDKDGKPTTPKVWSQRGMDDFQKSDQLRYAAQVMNDPELSESNPITRDQLQQCVVKEKDVPWNSLRFAICCDTAFWDGASRSRKDETVYIVHGYPRDGSGDVYVVEGDGSQTWRGEDLAHRLVSVVQRYRRQGRKIFAITDEDPHGGKRGLWKATLMNYFHDVSEPMPVFHEFMRGNLANDKVRRMVSAANFWVDGHVKVVESGPGVNRLMDQMAKIGQKMFNPRLPNDWVDAHADAFNPLLYNPMRRQAKQEAPWRRGGTILGIDGVDPGRFRDRDWLDEVPREPLR